MYVHTVRINLVIIPFLNILIKLAGKSSILQKISFDLN